MRVQKGVAVTAAVGLLSGCAAFTYPDGPKLETTTRPVALSDAITAAENLEISYLEAAGEQAMVDKLVKGSFVLAAATAIGGGLYGAHRDIVTGAAFAGATVYAGATLFGSPQQRAVYRTGAQALSCAITAVAPLTSIDLRGLETAHADLLDASRDYGTAAVGLENAIDAVPRPTLTDPAFATYNVQLAALDGAVAAATGAVDAALADGGASEPQARTAIRAANQAYAAYLVEAVTAKAASEAILSTALYRAADTAKAKLEALQKAPDHAPWMDSQILDGLRKVAGLRQSITDLDTARARRAKVVVDANTGVARARIDHQGWRLVPPRIEAERSKAAKIVKDLKDAGAVLHGASKDIHIQVLNQLERLEPDRAQILGAFGAVTGMTLASASTITADRDALFGRGGSVVSPPGTQAPVAAPPSGAGAPAPVVAVPPPVGAGAPAPAAKALDDTPVNRARLQANIDAILADPALPDRNDLENRRKQLAAVADQIKDKVDGTDGLKPAHAALRSLVDKVRNAHAVVRDQVEAVRNVDLTTIQSTCAGMVDPGIKPLKASTNQVAVDNTGSKFVYVSGGRGSYAVAYDKPTPAINVMDGYDPASGRFRYEIAPATGGGFTAGETYVLTISDDDDRKTVVTVTTR